MCLWGIMRLSASSEQLIFSYQNMNNITTDTYKSTLDYQRHRYISSKWIEGVNSTNNDWLSSLSMESFDCQGVTHSIKARRIGDKRRKNQIEAQHLAFHRRHYCPWPNRFTHICGDWQSEIQINPQPRSGDCVLVCCKHCARLWWQMRYCAATLSHWCRCILWWSRSRTAQGRAYAMLRKRRCCIAPRNSDMSAFSLFRPLLFSSQSFRRWTDTRLVF